MSKRKFNKESYDAYDYKAKGKLKEIIEKNSEYELLGTLDIEYYKECDIKFINKKTHKQVFFENEVRGNFDKIINDFITIHIPIRKKNTLANFYLVWNGDLTQFILIKRKTLRKYINNLVTIPCNEHIHDGKYFYIEDFIDVPKNETQWYVIGENYKLIKLDY